MWRFVALTGSVLALLLMFPSVAASAGIGIAPIRIDLSAARRASFVQLTNNDPSAKLIHARIFLWDQSTGKDRLTPTSDLVLSPPIFSLQPGVTQVIRMGLLDRPAADVERSYRVLITEVPATPLADQIRMVVEISVPLFVEPSAAPQARLQVTGRLLSPRQLALSLDNSGNAHSRYTRVVVRDSRTSRTLAEETGPRYVLAGQHITRVLRLANSAGAASLSVEVDSDLQTFHSSIAARP